MQQKMASWRDSLDSYEAMDIVKLLILAHVTLSIGLYVAVTLFGVTFKSSVEKMKPGKKGLLITAHPDDECMFFSPFLLRTTQESEQSEVHVLCLTNGDYYGQGRVREKEIINSCQVLGIPSNHVTVINDRQLPDNPTTSWDDSCLEAHICAVVDRLQPHQIVTFDDYGVSGHSNHISVSKAVRKLFLQKDKLRGVETVFYLESLGVWRKYLGLFDLPFTYLFSSNIHLLSPRQVLCAQMAMLSHRSQLEWFRVLYIVLSRYMMINSFVEQQQPHTECTDT